MHGDVGEVRPLVADDLGRLVAEELADGSAGAAAVVGGGNHHDVVAVGRERGREGNEAGRIHTVVVGDEDPHRFTVVAGRKGQAGRGGM